MSSAEFTEWQAYYSGEPFGDLRADHRTGILAALVANLGLGKHDKPAEPLDFITHGDATPAPATPAIPKAPPDAELRRRSQQDQIDAIKRFTAAKHGKG